MKIQGIIKEGKLVKRLNRFLVIVKIDGQSDIYYLPNPGRLHELIYSGSKVYIKFNGKRRKTKGTLIAAYDGKELVSVDTRLSNHLFKEAILHNVVPEFRNYKTLKTEVRIGSSRLDFMMTNENTVFIEVKSCTLVEKGIGLFPDAPTKRGTRHLKVLANLQNKGFSCYIVFIIQRSDATCLYPNDKTDPEFGLALRKTVKSGVGAIAYTCIIKPWEFLIDRRVPVKF